VTQNAGETLHWRTLVHELSTQVDSVKARLSWNPPIMDTTYLDSALLFFQTTKNEILALREMLRKEQEKLKSTPEPAEPTDSTAVIDIIMQDSVRLQFLATQDTIGQAQSNLERLYQEVSRLELITKEQRAEAQRILTPPVEKGFSPERMMITLRKNLIRDSSTVSFFDYPTWSSRIFIILLSLLYLYWIYKLGRKTDNDRDELRLHQNEPLWIPLLKSCIFFLVLLPLASFSVPILVLEGVYLIIFIFFFIILYPELSPFKRKVLAFVFLYIILLIASNLILSISWWNRLIAILINLMGILLVWTMGRRTDIDNPIGFIRKRARWAIMIGHILAIAAIVTGYIALGRTWALAAGIALLLAISLRAFRDMLLHDIEQQYERLHPDSMFRRFDLKRVKISIDRLIKIGNGLLILIVLLNIFDLSREARNLADQLLTAQHKIGNVTFSYANLLLAIAILWFSNWLQKTLKNLLGDKPYQQQGFKMALFPLFRLAIIILGLLVAVGILGLGMDKLTVIIGALSVGIGLGLQNIINNFVSGVILVFEKPFKLGDYVELADKKGQVLEIGIRSSTLLTDQGARVIIPNGDLLSGRLVNWTFAESDIRMNMHLNIETPIPISQVKDHIRNKLNTFNEVDRSIPIKVLTENIATTSYNLFIQVGIKDVRNIEYFRSRFLENIKEELDLQEIKISSS
jgi:small-conductance mechanosensitive channel